MSTESLAQSRAIAADGAALSQPAAGVLDRVRATTRLASIDIVRGLVIVIMALDHVRDYFTELRIDPMDLTQTSPELYLTRWITHFCAPTFIFLAGVSAYLVGQRCTRAQLSRFLLTRGFWLIALEFTVINWGWMGNASYELGLFLQVIWAIGISMIVLAGLVHLRLQWIGVFAVAVIAGHNLLDGIEPAALGPFAIVWNFLHVPTFSTPFGAIMYPIVPWVGVMALGYTLGSVFKLEPGFRRRVLVALGVAFISMFVVLRLLNGYGDPTPWSVQPTALYTVFSFFNVEKYPPSLMYVLITVGPGMLLLAALEQARGRIAGVLETFGRVPFIVYLAHIYLIHLFSGVVGLATGYGTEILTSFAFTSFPDSWGYSLPIVYLAWIAVIALLYPLARWFSGVKRRRKDWWLSYL
jgi:uncharacterized membrane protein